MKLTSSLFLTAALGMSIAAAGCESSKASGNDAGNTTGGGGTSGGGNCGVAPCGGDLVGNWTFTGACINPAALMDDFALDGCPTATLTIGNVSQTGAVMFTATDYSLNVTRSFSFNLNIPASCLTGGLTCPNLHAAFQAQLATSTDIASASCTGASACTCAIASTPMVGNETGTYTVAGNMFTTTSSTGITAPHAFCVQGNTAHFLETEMTMNMGSMGQITILSDEIAQRQ